MTSPAPVRRPRRLGGLGCLGQLALLAILSLVFVCVVDFVFAPWSYYLGGRMHALPIWQGIGRMPTPAGDFTLYVWMGPTPSGTSLHLPSVSGNGYLCTPRGERYVLRLTGGFPAKTGKDTNGKEMNFTLHSRPALSLFSRTDGRPRLQLHGRWNNPVLELDDGGSLSRAFLPDGTLYVGPASRMPPARERIAFAMHETSKWFSDCRGSEAR